MLSVVLISNDYIDSGTPTGLYTGALARCLASRGHDVHVICNDRASSDPHLTHQGTITVHRVETRKGASEHAFAVLAVKVALGFYSVGRCDVVECIDSPASVLSLRSLKTTGVIDVQIVHVQVGCAEGNGLDYHGVGIARVHARAVELKGWSSIGYPLEAGVWSPPAVEGRVFLACDATSAGDQQRLVEAYECSGAREEGWSLAMVNGNGRWSILSGASHVPSGQPARAAVITLSRSAAVGPGHAIWQGEMCVFAAQSEVGFRFGGQFASQMFSIDDQRSLVNALRSVVGLADEEYGSQAAAMMEIMGPGHESELIAQAHEQLWNLVGEAPGLDARAAVWKEIESFAVSAIRGGVGHG